MIGESHSKQEHLKSHSKSVDSLLSIKSTFMKQAPWFSRQTIYHEICLRGFSESIWISALSPSSSLSLSSKRSLLLSKSIRAIFCLLERDWSFSRRGKTRQNQSVVLRSFRNYANILAPTEYVVRKTFFAKQTICIVRRTKKHFFCPILGLESGNYDIVCSHAQVSNETRASWRKKVSVLLKILFNSSESSYT